MNVSAPLAVAGRPASFTEMEIDDFVAFVVAGGEVIPRGLRERVLAAEQLAFVRESSCLLGVGGLKRPSENHRNEVGIGSGIPISALEFPFELGWVFVLPSARCRKFSFTLCQPLVAAAQGAGVFATSQSTRYAMHSTLAKFGFSQYGTSWPSMRDDGRLLLFLRHAA